MNTLLLMWGSYISESKHHLVISALVSDSRPNLDWSSFFHIKDFDDGENRMAVTIQEEPSIRQWATCGTAGRKNSPLSTNMSQK